MGIRILDKSNSGMFQTGRAVKWFGFRIVLDAILFIGPLVQFCYGLSLDRFLYKLYVLLGLTDVDEDLPNSFLGVLR